MRRLNRTRKIRQSDKDLLLAVRRIVDELIPGSDVILYGSVARGEQTAESVYDVLVVTPAVLTREMDSELSRQIYMLELDKDVVISLQVFSAEQWERPIMKVSPFYHNVMIDGFTVC